MELLSIFFWYLLPSTVYLITYITMRKGLKKFNSRPAYAPPGWFFSLIWFVLYMLQGTAAWLLMRHNGSAWTYELTMYCVHLGLALLYGSVFSKGNKGLTFLYTLMLLVYGAVVDGFFFKKYAWSGWILLPTIIWLAFATWLSFTIYQNARISRQARKNRSDSEEVEEDELDDPRPVTYRYTDWETTEIKFI